MTGASILLLGVAAVVFGGCVWLGLRRFRGLEARLHMLERITSDHLGITIGLCSETQRAIVDAALKSIPDVTPEQKKKMN